MTGCLAPALDVAGGQTLPFSKRYGMSSCILWGTMYVKQCDCLLALLVDDDFCGRPDKFDPLYIFKTQCKFRSLRKYFIDKYICFKILSLIQKKINIIYYCFLRFMDFLFYFQLLIGVIAQSHSAQPKQIW
jgi:hypothetical protein